MSTEEEMSKLTYAVQHNPNCPMPFLVRLIAPGSGLLDLKPYFGFRENFHRSVIRCVGREES